jgi:hypothetical protein
MTVMSLQKARLQVGLDGQGVSINTLKRWILSGFPMADGTVLRLAAIRYGGRFGVTQAAIDEFIARLTENRIGGVVPPIIATSRDEKTRRKLGEKCGAKLKAAGW